MSSGATFRICYTLAALAQREKANCRFESANIVAETVKLSTCTTRIVACCCFTAGLFSRMINKIERLFANIFVVSCPFRLFQVQANFRRLDLVRLKNWSVIKKVNTHEFIIHNWIVE